MSVTMKCLLCLSIICELQSLRRIMQNVFYSATNHITDISENKRNILESSKGHIPVLWLVDYYPFSFTFCF